ncbi:MAG TPA: hypothetical protein DHV48_08980 [Prolixibacteraceae bacterium]|nr:hypothetical protein [Prolixibacteraceae bacterium]
MKTNSVNPKEDIQAIREIMERSSKFMLLNSWAGFFAGTCALIGAAVVWFGVLESGALHYDEFLCTVGGSPLNSVTIGLGTVALIVLLLAGVAAIWFSYRKAQKAGQKFWTSSTKRVLAHLLIPIVSGGIFVLILVSRNQIDLVASAMLIFYGLALVNAGKFTSGEIHYLGMAEIAVGLLAGVFASYGLVFWALGFGLLHLVYGVVMWMRYER